MRNYLHLTVPTGASEEGCLERYVKCPGLANTEWARCSCTLSMAGTSFKVHACTAYISHKSSNTN